jgi:hypothetical protein
VPDPQRPAGRAWDPDERFAALAETFTDSPGVSAPGESEGHGFGSSALTIDGSIFAMLTRGQLVVKLPRDRVKTLIGSGTGSPFTAGKDRPMQEWLTVTEDNDETWAALAREALTFVVHRPRPR